MDEKDRARILDRIQRRYGWHDDYIVNDPLDRTGKAFLGYARFREICEVLGEADRAEALERQQAIVTMGYWHYLFAPKGEDHVMPSLADWLHDWGVGGDLPETDPYQGVKNFEAVYGPLSNYMPRKKPRPPEGG